MYSSNRLFPVTGTRADSTPGTPCCKPDYQKLADHHLRNFVRCLMKLTPAISLFCLLILAACSTAESLHPPLLAPREESVFSFTSARGTQLYRLSKEDLKEFRDKWRPGSQTVAITSKLETDDRQWVMDFISIMLSARVDCASVSLKDITQIQPGNTPPGFGISSHATRFSEVWTVDTYARATRSFSSSTTI